MQSTMSATYTVDYIIDDWGKHGELRRRCCTGMHNASVFSHDDVLLFNALRIRLVIVYVNIYIYTFSVQTESYFITTRQNSHWSWRWHRRHGLAAASRRQGGRLQRQGEGESREAVYTIGGVSARVQQYGAVIRQDTRCRAHEIRMLGAYGIHQ